MVGGAPLIAHHDQLCHACLATKQTWLLFPKTAHWRASKPLELVQIDLCGPMTPSIARGTGTLC